MQKLCAAMVVLALVAGCNRTHHDDVHYNSHPVGYHNTHVIHTTTTRVVPVPVPVHVNNTSAVRKVMDTASRVKDSVSRSRSTSSNSSSRSSSSRSRRR